MHVLVYLKGRDCPIATEMDEEDLHDTLELLYQTSAKCVWLGDAFIYTNSIDYIAWENT